MNYPLLLYFSGFKLDPPNRKDVIGRWRAFIFLLCIKYTSFDLFQYFPFHTEITDGNKTVRLQ